MLFNRPEFEIKPETFINRYGNLEINIDMIDFMKDQLSKEENPSELLQEYVSLIDQAIKKIGLAKGGSLENAVVVKGNQVLNEDGLRNKKEFVNHKILDLVGDFLLSGHRVLGKVECYQGGHELSNKFLRKLMASKTSISTMELKEILIPKKSLSEKLIKIAVNA